jgi:hypothetical protein
MNRRSFLDRVLFGGGALYCTPPAFSRTKHVILIINGGGVRKREYYEDTLLAPNVRRLAREAYVFENDHCEDVFSHAIAFAELLQGREFTRAIAYPTILDYIGDGLQLDSIRNIPQVLEQYRPRIVVSREVAHDVGHESYETYLRAVKATDHTIGTVFDWVKAHPYFRHNTSIVVRPEFGRDDQLNEHGQLHHSYGFYYTHRVATIFWGPDFNQGVDKKSVISSFDMAPTLARLFNVNAPYAQGRVVPGLFRSL